MKKVVCGMLAITALVLTSGITYYIAAPNKINNPPIRLFTPLPIPMNEKIELGYISCEDEDMSKKCMITTKNTQFPLPDLATLKEAAGFDRYYYEDEINIIEGKIYVVAKGEFNTPVEGGLLFAVYEFDPISKTLSKIMSPDADIDMAKMAPGKSRPLVYMHRINSGTSTAVFRDVVVNGELQSSLVALLPQGDWQLGTDCRYMAACSYNKNIYWVTVLDENNIVLGFEKDNQQKYVYVPLENTK